MAKKNFFEQAKKSVSKLQNNRLSVEEENIPNTLAKKGMHIGARLKEARLIPVNKIKPDSHQPRKKFDEDKLKELSDSIKKHGIQQPISVEFLQQEDIFKIVFGERRYRAAQKAGLIEIPCLVVSPNSQERLAIQLIENIQRQDLSPIEKARGLLEFKLSLGKKAKWKDVEKITGISERRRRQFSALLDLPDLMQKEIVSLGNNRSNKTLLTEKHARALLRLKQDESSQQKLFDQIKEQKISGDDAMELARSIINANVESIKKITFKYSSTEHLIEQLRAKLAELEK